LASIPGADSSKFIAELFQFVDEKSNNKKPWSALMSASSTTSTTSSNNATNQDSMRDLS
jgi:hypothetical protein